MGTWALCGSIDRALNVTIREDDFNGVWGGPSIGNKEAAVLVNPDQIRTRLELVTLVAALKETISNLSLGYLGYRLGDSYLPHGYDGSAWDFFLYKNLNGLTIGRRMTNERQEVSGCFMFAGDRINDPRAVARGPVVGPCTNACTLVFDIDRLLNRDDVLAALTVVADGLIDYANEDPSAPLAELFEYH